MKAFFPVQDVLYDQGDDVGGVERGGGHYQSRVFQQSVTLTARMWPDEEGETMAPPVSPGGWRLPSEQLALLVGAVCGGALILALLALLIAWRCCVLPRRHKSYCTRIAQELSVRQRSGLPVLHSHSAVYADPKKGHWAYNSRLVSARHPPTFAVDPCSHWFYNSHVLSPAYLDPGPMSRSVSYDHHHVGSPGRRVSRPLSQPIRFGPVDVTANQEAVRCGHVLPEISEFFACAAPVQFASSSILDDVRVRHTDDHVPGEALKTRSLPAWVRSKPRPLSTEDNLSDLYAKVNFSKKRKNRMRNDEAAIIALSKSRSQYLHKDTDSLVDNEAVIVYNERTAL